MPLDFMDMTMIIWLLLVTGFTIWDRRDRRRERRRREVELQRLRSMTGDDVRREFAEVGQCNRRLVTRLETAREAVGDAQREFGSLADDVSGLLASAPVGERQRVSQNLKALEAVLTRVASLVDAPMANVTAADLDLAHDVLDEPPTR